MAEPLRSFGVGEITVRAIRAYRWLPSIALVTTLFVTPVFVLSAALQRFTYDDGGLLADPSTTHVITLIGVFIAVMLTYAALSLAAAGGQWIIASSAAGVPHDAESAMRYAARRLGPLVALAMASSALTLAGFALCIVPGLVEVVLLSVSVPALLIENLSVTDAIRRSIHLVRGNAARAIGVVSIQAVASFAVSLALTRVGLGLVGASGPHVEAWLVAQPALSILAATMVAPFTAGVSFWLYASLRHCREGYSTEQLADDLGGFPPGGPGHVLGPYAHPYGEPQRDSSQRG